MDEWNNILIKLSATQTFSYTNNMLSGNNEALKHSYSMCIKFKVKDSKV